MATTLATLASRALRPSSSSSARSISTFDDYLSALHSVNYGGLSYQSFTTYPTEAGEPIGNNLQGYVEAAYKQSGPVWAAMLLRMMTFSEGSFLYQRREDGRWGELFTSANLAILERPWRGGTTGDLLTRMIQDADLAGNFYGAAIDGELQRLRPDWCLLVTSERHANGRVVGEKLEGLLYWHGGIEMRKDPARFLAGEFIHFAPHPDPLANYRGMSWLTPVLREIEADKAATKHKLKFFENAATANLAVKLDPAVFKTLREFREWRDEFDRHHRGADNAYKTMWLRGALDLQVIGSDLKQMDFKATQGAGETRIAAAAGTHPVLLGLSEGLQGSSLNAGNAAVARRMFADARLFPLWRMAAGALETVAPPPPGGPSRLWYDTRDVPFLREDEKDSAEIQGLEARAIRTLLDAGYEGDSVVAAVRSRDWSRLVHSGLFSVQLQPPGTGMAPSGKFTLSPVDDDQEDEDGQ